jgi:poly(3-hydroxyalkanoate) synthetase
VDALQMLFSMLDPGSVGAKYRDFGTQDQDSARARMFVAIEDWLNDGVPLAAPVAREVLGGWYGRNTPARGKWRIAGLPVVPEMLTLPCFVAIPGKDRLVPPESAEALAEAVEGAAVVRPRAGHIGMVAGSKARTALWEPMLKWLL